MVFSSIVFLLFFLPALLITYYFAHPKYKNWVLLFFSIFFYSWGAPKFIFVLLGTTLVDFYLVQFMWKSPNPLQRKLLLSISVSINLGLLVYFKYSNFFIDSINSVLTTTGFQPIPWLELALPIGISFYTFETLTYVMDVYRGVHKPLRNFWDYQLYIILFPKLIAGPIIRYHDLADQIMDRTQNESNDIRMRGFYRFVLGLSKKVLLANQMGLQADRIFSTDFALLDTSTAWIGILAYTFQIYFDFSGYSDMAIGLGRMLGFVFPENFNNPYISRSITEFWRRWHMTLGAWMKNYLYIPLGGNRVKTKRRLYFNLWLVFLASGLWHGASRNFLIWGAYHGLLLVLERSFLSKVYDRIGRIPSTLITFLLVVLGWVFFRVENLPQALLYLQRMFAFRFEWPDKTFDPEFLSYMALALFFSFVTCSKWGNQLQNYIYFDRYSSSKHFGVFMLSLSLLILCISSITAFGFNPFIYFRF